MGRLMMSYKLEDEVVVPNTPPKKELLENIPIPNFFIEKWSASNAFDPDSDEFWEGQEIIHEAFVDTDVQDQAPSSPEPSASESSDDGHGRELSVEEREVRRRMVESSIIIRSMSTFSDATARGQNDAAGPEVQSRPEPEIITVPIPSTVSVIPSTPPPRAPGLPQMWTDLRQMSYSPIPFAVTPQTPSTPYGAPSPAPSATPHIYTWDGRSYNPVAPPSPSPSYAIARINRTRATGLAHRRRESLPASISLMG